MTKLSLVPEPKMQENENFDAPLVELHPDSLRYLKLGHPWIIEDSFTKKFPDNIRFIAGPKTEKDPFVFLNTPFDKKIKARLIGRKSELSSNWQEEIKKRLKESIEKREVLVKAGKRENIYLVFAENDYLPGLKILLLKNYCIIQYLLPVWKDHEKLLVETIETIGFLPKLFFIGEDRFENAKSANTYFIGEEAPTTFNLQEFDLNYEIRLEGKKDYGIFTDMSGMRQSLSPYFGPKKTLLNLFCFTGAFSFYALKNEMDRVVSVDLSKDHLAWLDKNKELNPDLALKDHRVVKQNALSFLRRTNEQFDTILVDPPTLITDGKKTLNTLKFYRESMFELARCLKPKGRLILFCHIHHLTIRQVRNKLENIIKSQKLNLRMRKEYKMKEDCRPLSGFPEGSYLKCFIVEKP